MVSEKVHAAAEKLLEEKRRFEQEQEVLFSRIKSAQESELLEKRRIAEARMQEQEQELLVQRRLLCLEQQKLEQESRLLEARYRHDGESQGQNCV